MSKKIIKKFSTVKVQLRNFTDKSFVFKSGDICRPNTLSVPLFEDEVIALLKEEGIEWKREGSCLVVGKEPTPTNLDIGKEELELIVCDTKEVVGELKDNIRENKANGYGSLLLESVLKDVQLVQGDLAKRQDGKTGEIELKEIKARIDEAKKYIMLVKDLTPKVEPKVEPKVDQKNTSTSSAKKDTKK